jgi:hypothetical protein
MGSTSWLAAWRDGVTTTRSGHHLVDREAQPPADQRLFQHLRRIARIGFDADDAIGEAKCGHHLGVRREDRDDALWRLRHGDAAIEGVAHRHRLGLRRRGENQRAEEG